jgi:hypothetical protein
MSSLVHIAPQLPPAIDGVGDYCSNLWQHWPEAEPDWIFLVTRGAAQTAAVWRNARVCEFECGNESLRTALEQTGCDTVLLHYVGYAYQPKGIPLWLPGAIEQWKRGDARRRLVIMFHEMYARSSPLRSPFWVAPFARRIIHQLAALSDAWVTSCNRYFRQLTMEFDASPSTGRIIPIGSNIPVASPLGAKQLGNGATIPKFRFVVFGLAKTRLWALEKHWRLLRALGEAEMIEHVTLLGKHPEPEDERAWQRFADVAGARVAWRKQFDFVSADVSRELAAHDFGLLANEPDILTKSGVFAALATHGVIPLVAGARHCSLPRLFHDAALVNEDTPESVMTVSNALRDDIALSEMRERLLALASTELAWPRITRTWKNVLEHFVEPGSALQREPAPSQPRHAELEVGASTAHL